jgi:hypothetical protein
LCQFSSFVRRVQGTPQFSTAHRKRLEDCRSSPARTIANRSQSGLFAANYGTPFGPSDI